MGRQTAGDQLRRGRAVAWIRNRRRRDAARSVVASYRESLARFAQTSVLETWYARVTMEDVFAEFADEPKMVQRLRKSVADARHQTTEHVFHKITTSVGGQPWIKDQHPLLFHPEPADFNVERDAQPFFSDYATTLAADRRALFGRFSLADVAYKVVGVGSVGTRCFVALFNGDQGDHLFLQVKEARGSVLEGQGGSSPYANNGERVVQGQRLMQSASDVFLGWGRMRNRDYYVHNSAT